MIQSNSEISEKKADESGYFSKDIIRVGVDSTRKNFTITHTNIDYLTRSLPDGV
jgi:hypothetical protein